MRYIASFFQNVVLVEGGLFVAISTSGLGATVLTTFSPLVYVSVFMGVIVAAMMTLAGE